MGNGDRRFTERDPKWTREMDGILALSQKQPIRQQTLDEVPSTEGGTRIDPEEEIDGASKGPVVKLWGIKLLGISSVSYPRLTDILGTVEQHRIHGTS